VICASIFMGVDLRKTVDDGYHSVLHRAPDDKSQFAGVTDSGTSAVSSTEATAVEVVMDEIAVEQQYILDPNVSVDSIDVDWVAGSVTIAASDGNEIVFYETSGQELNENTKLQYSALSGELKIQYCADNKIQINTPDKNLMIFLPADIAANLKTLDIDATSAFCTVSGLSSDNIRIDTVSGDVIATDTAVGTARLNTVSGIVSYEGSADGVYGSTVSGSFTANISSGDAEIEVETDSGLVQIYGSVSSVELDSVSGNAEISCSSGLFEVDAETTSGDVTLIVPTDLGLSLEFESVSGDFESEASSSKRGDEYSINGGGRAEYDVSTVSGDLHILSE